VNGGIKFAALLIAALAIAGCNAGGSSSMPGTPGQSATSQSPVGSQQSSAVRQVVVPQTGSRYRFAVIPYQGRRQIHPPGSQIPLWNGSFMYNGSTYSYTMVGANPATSNVTTTIPVDIIPITVVVTQNGTTYVFRAGKRVVKRTAGSPIFQSGIDFVQGGTDLGNTQYIDAFQRGNFWTFVKINTNYHTLLSPTVLPKQTFSGGTVGNEFGVQVGLVDINTFDRYLEGLINTLKIPPTTFPIFLTHDVYLTSSGCCIGGYHSYNGTNTYAMATYISKTGVFSQDVSALSHEVGEWYDDPLTNNGVACGILEVGDPLENGQPGHPYGTWAYTLKGFTYHLQDLVFLPYFGAPPNTSVNSWFTFQGYNLTVCQNGG
jgi:hypothetical protein